MVERTDIALVETALDGREVLQEQPGHDGQLPGHGGQPNRVLASLRGRYHWAVLLGLLFAALGAAAGYTIWTPQYQSTGLIQVAPILPRILYKTEETTMLPMYEGYINSQMDLIRSRRVTDWAMQKPEWKELRRGLSDEAVEEFRQQLTVQRGRGSQIIMISFVDEDSKAPVRGVKSVIEAYMEIFVDRERMTRADRLKTLENMQRRHATEIKRGQEDMQGIAEDEFAWKSLELVHQARLTEKQRIAAMLDDLAVEAAGLKAIIAAQAQQPDTSQGDDRSDAKDAATQEDKTAAVAKTASDPPPVPEKTSLEIAADRRVMESLIQQKTGLELELQRLSTYYSANHSSVKETEKQLANTDQLLAPYLQRFREAASPLATASLLDGPDPAASAKERLLVNEARRKVLAEQLATVKQDVQDLVRKIARLDAVKVDVEEAHNYLQRTKARLDELNVESSVSGRITIMSEPSSAGTATNLGKRKQLVVLGGMGGLTVGVGIVVLIGLADRRYRYVADAQNSIGSLPLIGVLPQLPQNLGDPDQAAIAAHGVQQIRVQLQLGSPAERKQVLTVTSPTPGDGKTSLAMALGLSFAASRAQTLLVDFDLFGRGLTRQSECIVREKIGPVLLREKLVTTDQLAEGLERAGRSKCRLGEALVGLGVLTEDDVKRALALQAKSTVGLHEVLDGQPLDTCIHPTDNPFLSILPVGDSGPELIGSLAPESVGRLLEQARQQYNTIIIDTGPVPASTEASLIASQSDAVILAVSQGVQQQAAERAVTHLKSISARITGVVFNRARRHDMEHSGFSSGVGSRPSGGSLPGQADASGNGSVSSRFGPVAHAAALALPSAKGGHTKPKGQTDKQGPAAS